MTQPHGFRRFGPGFLVTAAFIGPGTVTTATVAGADFGHALLWVLLFSVLAAIVLQEMSARLGVVGRRGLGEALRSTFPHPAGRATAAALVIAAIGFGNAAFQVGNVTGAALGLETLTGVGPRPWSAAVGAAAFGLLATGAYRWIEGALMALVAVMGAVFVATMCFARPDLGAVLDGVAVPRLPEGSGVAVLALIGTTVVPYNLFLHASAARQKWPASMPTGPALGASRRDTVVSVALGGLVTGAIMVTAATVLAGAGAVEDGAAMAAQLEPLLGPAARFCFAIGLFAAGLTSAVTAPLAAAYAITGVLGWRQDLRDLRFRAVWAAIVLAGTLPAIFGTRPVAAIVFAQAANGFLLPLVAVFLLIAVNGRVLPRRYRNGAIANGLGLAVVAIVVALGAARLLSALR